MAQWKQREICPAEVGDKIYFISGDWGKPTIVTVTGICDEGSGYEAFSEVFAAQWHANHPDGDTDPPSPDDDPNWKPGSIHTCNGFVCKTHTEARAESLRIAKKEIERWKQKRKEAEQVIQYYNWVISRKGKH